MQLGEILLAENLVQQSELERALIQQRDAGGDLGQHLLEIGAIEPDLLAAVQERQPRRPKSVRETGLSLSFLTDLALKSVYREGLDCTSAIADELKLSPLILQSLVDHLRERQFIEPLGSAARPDKPLDVHFALSDAGRARAVEAIGQSGYVGPAPVPLAAFEAQIKKQSLAWECVDRDALSRGLSDLMVAPDIFERMGLALNSGQPILMYGPPGNGKSMISRAATRCLRQLIYLPRCIEVDGQVVQVFDPTLHEEVVLGSEHEVGAKKCTVNQSTTDERWVCCRRPMLSTGVELTLEMLDLNFHPHAHFYDAPLQMRASGGVIFVNDFGRQLLRPIDILNRWIVPLEHGADYLTLETGRKFSYAFDVLLIFSTNLPLKKVMKADIMRRIPYQIRVSPPTRDEFVVLLRKECTDRAVELPEDLLSYLIDELYAGNDRPFARYHPSFIVEHAIAGSKFNQRPVRLDREVLTQAMDDLFTED